MVFRAKITKIEGWLNEFSGSSCCTKVSDATDVYVEVKTIKEANLLDDINQQQITIDRMKNAWEEMYGSGKSANANLIRMYTAKITHIRVWAQEQYKAEDYIRTDDSGNVYIEVSTPIEAGLLCAINMAAGVQDILKRSWADEYGKGQKTRMGA